MTINKTASATVVLFAVVVFFVGAALPPEHNDKFQNLKVLPKNISHQQLHQLMDDWSHALGVRCNFCHARNEEAKKMDFVSDAKPEKEMARHMFNMTAKINKKFFKAGKDSLGMVMESSVNCNTCHHGSAHPEIMKQPEGMRADGPPPADKKP